MTVVLGVIEYMIFFVVSCGVGAQGFSIQTVAMLKTVENVVSPWCLCQPLQLNGHTVLFTVETGASDNFITKETWRK